ncbi:hypothetical protein SMACR_07670 [Sordaria macrospora]|uniref:WGS project CABT00000000 data, contig 2.27 n=2 Tax=Sordaria macrospora TaxID=5147 RepID=F7W4H9_SORMK|nr:uncharacterized protein SMAC_07670 [Sordaria macrospora k-hell]KAA8634859.1 hypothetical protein SMACR_07670 [Sordaria macrospora]KAH7635498.1 hypothetical protein B0T09DRAFT_298146 [Sordaria sp. MPI-SDFR-AT-0083]WPJ67430.1 hypothetical protein SMAC4_07670 [Sordaria macrospora]CCC14932.1 unnamed protein product [Sordaria macrospora k-hell]
MQYGLDSACLAALQAMPGFLKVFGYPDPSAPEVAPPHLRGVMVALFSEWVCIGSVLGAVTTNATKGWMGKASWRVPLGILFVVPVVLSAGVWWAVPESPRWEVSRGRYPEGRRALERVRVVREDDKEGQERLEVEWVEMVRGIEEEKRLASTVGPLDMFRGSDLRRTLLCFGVIATQAGSGSWFYISYSTYFMIVSGLPVELAFRYSIMKTCIGFIGVNVGMYLMRYVMGRRTLMTTGAVVQSMFMLGMAISASTEAGTKRARDSLIACSALFNFEYNAFVGIASYPVATELFINPENMNWGAKYGYIWAGSSFCCALFFFFFLPELKGRALEEIDELFERKVPAWKFKSAETSIVSDAIKEVRQRGEVREDRGKASTVEIQPPDNGHNVPIDDKPR